MAEAIMAIGVFTDNTTIFAKALDLWRGRVPGYFYLTSDGPTPIAPDHSSESPEKVVANWHGQKVFSGHDGLCQVRMTCTLLLFYMCVYVYVWGCNCRQTCWSLPGTI